MVKLIKLIGIYLLIFIFIQNREVYADFKDYTFVSKQKLVYEVTDVILYDDYLRIEGWGFINESQHYDVINKLKGNIELINPAGNLQYDLSFFEKDMTYLMKMDNRNPCLQNDYNKSAEECYYVYKYVGWYVEIPYEDLVTKYTYFISLQMESSETNQAYRVLLYTSLGTKRLVMKDYIVETEADILDNSFYVNHDFVMARKKPGKDGDIYYGKQACSKNYQNLLYFKPGSQFNNVYNSKIINDVHWYQVGISEYGCQDGRLYAIEDEKSQNLAWIPSSFIEYNGSVFRIAKYVIAPSPQIIIENPTVYVGDETFNPDDYVHAYDSTDGILIPKRGRNNLNINKKGVYYVEYSATNSANKTSKKNMFITVIEKQQNTAPIIYANDRYINQYDYYDPLYNVLAIDEEEGDITNRLVVLNKVNSKIAETQEQCFYVADSENLNTTKCIYVYIKPKTVITSNNSLRFIDRKVIWTDNKLSNNWLSDLSLLRYVFNIKNSLFNESY